MSVRLSFDAPELSSSLPSRPSRSPSSSGAARARRLSSARAATHASDAADDPEAEEPVITRGAGEGVTFDAIDDFLAGGTKVLHIPRAVENRSVKFFYVPRLGGYACAPFVDQDGEIKGLLCLDLLGLAREFTPDELSLVESLSERIGTALNRIEYNLAQEFHKQTEEINEHSADEEAAHEVQAAEDNAAAAADGDLAPGLELAKGSGAVQAATSNLSIAEKRSVPQGSSPAR